MVYCKLVSTIANREAYKMTVTKDRIEIEAGAPAGIFFAMQTIRQLLPAEINRDVIAKDVVLAVLCAVIEDEPRYPYRGMCLDVCRHFSDIATDTHVEYMLFPRLTALAEAVWTPKNEKNYENYMSRLTGVLKHYDAMNINYSRSNLK